MPRLGSSIAIVRRSSALFQQKLPSWAQRIARYSTATEVLSMQLRSRTKPVSQRGVEPLPSAAPLPTRARRNAPRHPNNVVLSSIKDRTFSTKEVHMGSEARPKRARSARQSPRKSPSKKAKPSAKDASTNASAKGEGEVVAPANWERVMKGIQEMRAGQDADVDVAGIETFYDDVTYAPHVARFRVLISAMLSSQTKDPVNAAAMKRLTAHGLTVESMLAIDERELAQLIRPVGFFNNKAKYIKQVAQILTDKYTVPVTTTNDSNDVVSNTTNGHNNKATTPPVDRVVDIPNTYDALIALPGIGPKMATLIMTCAWKSTMGICVDTHVHRIANRLGWVRTWNTKTPKSQDPEKTRAALEDWLPHAHWAPVNPLLVGFGQTVCLPRAPQCGSCTIRHLCPSAHHDKTATTTTTAS